MSYQDAVVRESPIGLWPLNAYYVGQDISIGKINSTGQRVLNPATIGISTVSTDIAPICTGGNNSVKLDSTSTSTVTIANNYEVFYKNTENKDFMMEFWVTFNDIPSSTTVVTIGTSITLNFSHNTAKLTIKDSNSKSYYATLNVDNYDTQFHIVIKYSKRRLSFLINGEESTRIIIDNNAYFFETSQHNIVFGPGGTGEYFILDYIAFYDYLLNAFQINNHINWALLEKNPSTYTVLNGGGIYSPSPKDGVVAQKFIFDSKSKWRKASINNLVTNGNLLTFRKLPPLYMYHPSKTAGSPTYNATDGFAITNSGDSARFERFNQVYDPNMHTISAEIKYSNSNTFFSISGFSFGTLGLVSGTTSLSLTAESESGMSSAATVTGLTVGNTYQVKITFSSDQITLTVGSTSASYTLTTGNVSISNSNLYIGNYYTSSSPNGSATSGYIRNFSVFMNNDSRISTPANTGLFSLKLISNLNVSQYGEWITTVGLNSDITIAGSKIYHDSHSKNISIYGSVDYSTWIQLNNSGDQAPGIASGSTGKAYYIKVTMECPESYDAVPSLSRLELITYSSLNSFSYGSHVFSIKEDLGSGINSNNYSHTIKSRDFNTLSRSKNFGITFQKVDASAFTYANVPKALLSSTVAFTCIEFWLRINEAPTSGTRVLFSSNGTSTPTLSISSAMLLTGGFFTGSNIYVNGQTVSQGTGKTLVVGELYHILLIVPSSTSAYINGLATAGSYTGAYATYSDICIYPTAPTVPAFALKKYNLKIGNNKQVVSDNNYIIPYDSGNVSASTWRIYS